MILGAQELKAKG